MTPLYASINKIIEVNKGCVCLVQVGSFYEIYFEQAQEYGPKLGLKVATRKTTNNMIPMAGFPTFQLQKFVKMLIQDYKVNVAIIDQYPMEKRSMDAIIHRKVSRIVTPGTLVDETFLNYNQNNYLAAIYLPPGCTKTIADPSMEVGLSWVDLSVGEFYVQKTTLEDLVSDIFRISPSEIIMPKELQTSDVLNGSWYSPLYELRRYFLRYHQTVYKDLKLSFTSNFLLTRKALELYSIREEAAMNMVLSYIHVNIPESNPVLDIPQQYWNEKYIRMDPRTRESLELTERSTGGRKSVVGTLMNTIKNTVTPSGSRMLGQWLNSPILDIDTLNYRYNFVETFQNDIVLTQALRANLVKVGDFIRSLQRLSFGAGDTVTHLASISDGLYKLEKVKELLIQQKRSELWKNFLQKFTIPVEVADKINQTLILNDLLVEDETKSEKEDLTRPLITTKFYVRQDYNENLKDLHIDLEHLLEQERELLLQIADKISGIDPKLVISKREAHGRFLNVIHVSGKTKLIEQVNSALARDVREKRKSTLIIKPLKWSVLQSKINAKVDEIMEVEHKVIAELRVDVLKYAQKMRAVSQLGDFLDIVSSFGLLAHEAGLVRPKVIQQPKLDIQEGRHIVVESGLKTLGEMFVPNSTQLGSKELMWMITGPNMGGKSTFLRQNALIVIMAQIGCFIPATKATIGVVDRIFTRIGASDDLFNDLSTFMVEMVETSNILKHATSRSLAIVDEIGRGTSGKEGLAVAYAALVHLLEVNNCRTLFATHFGKELMQLLEEEHATNLRKLQCYRTSVVQKNNHIIMNHSLEPGITERSYALEVAKMAKFPPKAMDMASKTLQKLNQGS